MRWRGSGARLGDSADPATIARTLAYLFGFGAVLLLATLLLPGSAQRQDGPLVAIAAYAIAMKVSGYEGLFGLQLAMAAGTGGQTPSPGR